MNISKLKKNWQKLLSWHDNDGNKLSVDPSLVWVVLVCLFFVGLVAVFGGLIFLKTQIYNKQVSIIANSGIVTEKLDEQKLKFILIDHSKRVGEFEKLESTKPSVIDPGV